MLPALPAHVPLQATPSMTLNLGQNAAVNAIASWWRDPNGSQLFRLGGYAGTGKTSLLIPILEALNLSPQDPLEIEAILKAARRGEEVPSTFGSGALFCAPTGRATSVLNKKFKANPSSSFWQAMTIHSALYIPRTSPTEEDVTQMLLEKEPEPNRLLLLSPNCPPDFLKQFSSRVQQHLTKLLDDPKFDLRAINPAQSADLIIVDESSMVDDLTKKDLLAIGTRILAIGDPGQLPPIASGNHGLFPSDVQPDALLTEIMRQGEGSAIIHFANAIREGASIPTTNSIDGSVEILPHTAIRNFPLLAPDTSDLFSSIIICGKNDSRHTLNQGIRHHLGIPSNSLLPWTGEPIITLKNQYKNKELILTNGQIWRCGPSSAHFGLYGEHTIRLQITDPEDSTISHEVDVLGKTFKESSLGGRIKLNYPNTSQIGGQRPDRFMQADFAYVITCHKSQGSEWPAVTVIDESSVFRAHARRWLYTALTRAQTHLRLIRSGRFS